MDNKNQNQTVVKVRRSDSDRVKDSVKNRQLKGYKTFSMMISPSMQQMFDAIAQERGLQKKEVIEQLIKDEYKNLNAA